MKRDLASFDDRTFDVLVIGGGIVGASIARDAARRGLSVALCERDDFACATSEAMSHMVHGGIRYLATGGIGNVRESLAERAIWRRVAPHKVDVIDCLMPLTGTRAGNRFAMRAAVALFNLLGGRNVAEDRPRGPSFLSADAAARFEPAIAQEGLDGALTYLDCRVDEPERVVLALLADAVGAGAAVANHLECVSLRRSGDAVSGAVLADRLGGGRLKIAARTAVNATGPWAGSVAARLIGGEGSTRLTLSKGVHLVAGPIARRHALTLAGRGEHAVVMPWRGFSLIGTTDERFEGDPAAVSASDAEIDGLVAKIRRLLPEVELGPELARFAAVRALPGSADDTYRMSREATIVDHGAEGASGLVSAFGGKWTTARKMAERCVDLVSARLRRTVRDCDTATAALSETPQALATYRQQWKGRLAGWPNGAVDEVIASHGTGVAEVARRVRHEKPSAAEIEEARFAQAVEAEMAMTPADVARRMARWHGIANPGVEERAAAWMAGQVGIREEGAG